MNRCSRCNRFCDFVTCDTCHAETCAQFDLDPETGGPRYPSDYELDISYLAERAPSGDPAFEVL